MGVKRSDDGLTAWSKNPFQLVDQLDITIPCEHFIGTLR